MSVETLDVIVTVLMWTVFWFGVVYVGGGSLLYAWDRSSTNAHAACAVPVKSSVASIPLSFTQESAEQFFVGSGSVPVFDFWQDSQSYRDPSYLNLWSLPATDGAVTIGWNSAALFDQVSTEQREGTAEQKEFVLNLKGMKVYTLHKKKAVLMKDLPFQVPERIQRRKLRGEDAVYLRDLETFTTVVG
ncbi:hypothetical protein H6F88_30110 [Oculatella sp. FACHB-28]|uniref:hypothetical protein n=1 Tax=Cyanophyceae TaxID=3028117 RepID=UPI001689E8FF|nr:MULTISPECIES: hypothetical protein [Cyanophyceae]MBD1997291.1 hypothetical protein [Leptolyngbya sp. FACHB-541]MBD2060202.1 hypothetical protein [Oculatella sp. FACHB-28]